MFTLVFNVRYVFIYARLYCRYFETRDEIPFWNEEC